MLDQICEDFEHAGLGRDEDSGSSQLIPVATELEFPEAIGHA
jgi:hypothetical protein